MLLLRNTLVTLSLALALPFTVGAQSVFIPDVNMRNWLNAQVPGCVDGTGHMDTTNVDLVAMPDDRTGSSILEVTWAPSDLEGLQYLQGNGALSLHFKVAGATSLPAFPRNITRLKVIGYPNSTLPPIPASVADLDLEHLLALTEVQGGGAVNDLVLRDLPALTAVPAVVGGPLSPAIMLARLPLITALPDLTLLDRLTIDSCGMFGGIAELPAGITSLTLCNLPALTHVPLDLPSVREMFLWDLPLLTHVPLIGENALVFDLDRLPNVTTVSLSTTRFLLELHVRHMANMTALEALPDTAVLIELDSLPKLTALALFPQDMADLWISNAPLLTVLPAFPATLYALRLNVPITELPHLPSTLQILSLTADELRCLPFLPISLRSFDLYASQVTCLPNHLPAGTEVSYSSVDTSIVCSILTSSCPSFSSYFTGTLFFDANANGIHDPEEGPYANARIHVMPLDAVLGVDTAGRFRFAVEPGDYELSILVEEWYVQGVVPSVQPVHIADAASSDSAVFAVQAIGQPDLMVHMVAGPPRPGFSNWVSVVVRNNGPVSCNGTVTLTVPSEVHLVHAAPLPSIQADAYTWDFRGLSPGASRYFQLEFSTPSTTPLGTIFTYTVSTLPEVLTDLDLTNNTQVLQDPVVGSCDPNDKRVQPEVLLPEAVAAGTPVTYTIRFQNTGTYHAERVLITDTLSEDLQVKTIRLLGSSHPCSWFVRDRALHVLFEPIFLPDSTSDEAGSHGFVVFSIAPDAGLVPGGSVSNTANIYFDFNEPVITEPAVFGVEVGTSIATQEASMFRAYPNPVEDELFMQWPGGGAVRFELLDATGRRIRTGAGCCGTGSLNMKGIAPGAYLLRMIAGSTIRDLRVIHR